MKKSSQSSLFERGDAERLRAQAPLAERLRPGTVEQVVGQEEVLGPETFLGQMLRGATPPRSCILWGPPGTGKTTIARLLAGRSGYDFVSLSAVLSGVKDIREVIEAARQRRGLSGKGTIVFVDEIHRF
ncbi:MAG TPA: AAA family ATPase, partial [Candidatus Binatia bacterium]|nr:AAA family ATPase [Candidatus Binatia bacterium]